MARTLVRRLFHLILTAGLLCGPALARDVAIQGLVLNPVIETKTLPSGREGLPVWFLARLKVDVQNGSTELRLTYGPRSLRFAGGSWTASGFTLPAPLPAPESFGGSLHLPLEVLRILGLPVLADTPEILDFAGTPAAATTPPVAVPPGAATAPAAVPPPGAKPAPPASSSTQPPSPPQVTPAPTSPPKPPSPSTPTPPPVVAPPASGPSQLGIIRSSRRVNRNLEYQRLVLEFSAPVTPQQARDKGGLTLTLPGASGSVITQTLESGDIFTVTPQPGGLAARLTTSGGTSTVFTLQNPFRVVVDTVTNLDPSVPPPPDPAKRPVGVSDRLLGKLHLVSFDPGLYQPHVVSAPLGSALPLADLVTRAGGVAGVNGGYFDTASSIPVDLVLQGGLMTAPSLERRATLGLDAQGGVIYGFPRPRYVLSGDWGEQLVNTVTARPSPKLLTLFVGDGHTPTGSNTLLSLTVGGTLGTPLGMSVTRAQTGVFVPAQGELTLCFDPLRFPQLPRSAGSALGLRLDWRVPGWDAVQEAVSAGPLLVSGGQYALDPLKEGFNTLTNVWRPTRQVAFGTLEGRPTIAYYEYGTPEDFARALAAAGVSDALRMDSGTSATVFYAGGFLNTVWSRPVVNAIVMVPRGMLGLGGGR